MKQEILEFGPVRLLDIRGAEPGDYDETGATHIRAVLPSGAARAAEMQRRGYLLADRTVGASIRLARPGADFERLARMRVVESGAYREDILRIARESFPEDRRFHILPECDGEVAGRVLAQWVADLETPLVCLYKGAPAGFLALTNLSGDAAFVHLAAADEKYRAAGAALSLYAAAALKARERGCKRLEGRISTRNTAVMNLYAYLGASFAAPEDIFLKEARA